MNSEPNESIGEVDIYISLLSSVVVIKNLLKLKETIARLTTIITMTIGDIILVNMRTTIKVINAPKKAE